MPDFEIICLANSRKRSGRCVAGLRTDGQGWLRPTGWNLEGILSPKHYTLPDGSEAGLLDVLSIPCDRPRPKPYHPEDWLLDNSPDAAWQLVARPAAAAQIALLRSSLEPGPEVLGSRSDRIPAALFKQTPAKASLAVVQPDDLHWLIQAAASGEKRLRARFTLRGAAYNLSLTDPRIEQALRDLAPGTHPRAAAGIPDNAEALLTVSLGEPFQPDPSQESCCFKLVAAVIALPD